MRNTIKLLSMLPLLALLTGCDWYEAELETHWTFDGLGCHAAGVNYVEILLEDDDGHIHETGLVPCREGSVLFRDLPEGRVRIRAWGYHRPRSGYSWELRRRIWIHDGYNVVTLDLAPVY